MKLKPRRHALRGFFHGRGNVRSQLQTVNSEIGVQPEHVQSAKTRADVRQEGRLAIRAGKVASGELNM